MERLTTHGFLADFRSQCVFVQDSPSRLRGANVRKCTGRTTKSYQRQVTLTHTHTFSAIACTVNPSCFRAQSFLDLHSRDHPSGYRYHFEPVDLFLHRETHQSAGVPAGCYSGHPTLDWSCFSPALTEIQDSVLYCHSNAVLNLSRCAPLPRNHKKPVNRLHGGIKFSSLNDTIKRAIEGNLGIKTRLHIGQVPAHLSAHATFSHAACLLTTRGHNSKSSRFPMIKTNKSVQILSEMPTNGECTNSVHLAQPVVYVCTMLRIHRAHLKRQLFLRCGTCSAFGCAPVHEAAEPTRSVKTLQTQLEDQ